VACLPAGFSFCLVRSTGGLPDLRFFCRLLLIVKAPAACFAAETLILLFSRYWWSAFQTKNLIHWFSCREIVAREPAFSVKWACILMLAPV
jgi:hypothetical protein